MQEKCRCCGRPAHTKKWTNANTPPGVKHGDMVEVCSGDRLFCPDRGGDDGLVAAKDNSDIQHYLDREAQR